MKIKKRRRKQKRKKQKHKERKVSFFFCFCFRPYVASENQFLMLPSLTYKCEICLANQNPPTQCSVRETKWRTRSMRSLRKLCEDFLLYMINLALILKTRTKENLLGLKTPHESYALNIHLESKTFSSF